MTKEDKIKLLLTSTKMDSNFLQMFKSWIERMPMLGTMPEDFKKVLYTAFENANEQLLAKQIAVYLKWLSEEAIDSAIAFYGTPAGQEVINNMPHINEDMGKIGQEIGLLIVQELEKSGVMGNLDSEDNPFNLFGQDDDDDDEEEENPFKFNL